MLIVPIFLCFFIFTSSYSDSVDKPKAKTNFTSSVPTKIQLDGFNKEKLTLESEGGAISSNMATLGLPKENPIFLMGPDKKVSINRIKGRKEAIMEDSENISIEQNNAASKVKQSNNNNVFVKDEGDTQDSLNSSMASQSPNDTTIHKPLILSAKGIEKADLKNSDPAVEDVDDRTSKIHKMTTNRHPEMIMPIVITMLVVPMFAVIGYMALKRGREAWKNRHYKRMDFLLDGMYNDE